MRHYFRRYAFGNATLEQFLAALEEGSGRDLQRLGQAVAGDGVAEHHRARSGSPTATASRASRSRRRAPPRLPDAAPAPPRCRRSCATSGGALHRRRCCRSRSIGAEAEVPAARRACRSPRSCSRTTTTTATRRSRSTRPRWRSCGRTWSASTTRSCVSCSGRRSGTWSATSSSSSTEYLALVREKLPLEPVTELAGCGPRPGQRRARPLRARGPPRGRVTTSRSSPTGRRCTTPRRATRRSSWARAVIADRHRRRRDIERVARLADGAGAVAGLHDRPGHALVDRAEVRRPRHGRRRGARRGRGANATLRTAASARRSAPRRPRRPRR